jgi:UrcA family protein
MPRPSLPIKTLIAIAGAAALLATSGQAEPLDDTYTVRVRYADLDTNRPSGRTVLEGRVRAAIERICSPGPAPIQVRQYRRYRTCRTVTWESVRPELARIYGGRRQAKAELQVSAAGAN